MKIISPRYVRHNVKSVSDTGVDSIERTYIEPAIGICDDCGSEVVLNRFTCACSCGADYNSAGQRLADRSQWGEDTGETAADVLAVDADNWYV